MLEKTRSRFAYVAQFKRDDGYLLLEERTPFTFRQFADTNMHQVSEGDSLWTLAGHYFAPLPRACGYWWAIADFQPDPIFDPTLVLEPRSLIYVPSVRVLTSFILADPATWPK